jgi:hypothetical protein
MPSAVSVATHLPTELQSDGWAISRQLPYPVRGIDSDNDSVLNGADWAAQLLSDRLDMRGGSGLSSDAARGRL